MRYIIMTRKESIAKVVIDHIAEEMEIKTSLLHMGTTFESLKEEGLNSLFFVKIIIDLEQTLNVSFEDNKLILTLYETIGDLIDYILQQENC